jgi:hypothetical protein
MASMFSARAAGTSNMPRLRTTFLRGMVVTLSTPAILIGVVVLVFLTWLVALALGFQGPSLFMANALGMPPIGTTFDLQIISLSLRVTDPAHSLLAALPFMVGRAVLVGVVLGISVDVLDRGRATADGALRGVLVAPMVLIVTLIELGFLFVGNIVGSIAGAGLGVFVQVGAIAAGVYLLGYAPVAQLREGRGVLESLSLSTAAARIPGSSSLALAVFYAVPSVFLQFVVSGLGVNPSPQLWAFVLFANILHVAVMATYAYRWMCVEDEVPEPSARRRRDRS